MGERSKREETVDREKEGEVEKEGGRKAERRQRRGDWVGQKSKRVPALLGLGGREGEIESSCPS